MNNADPITPDVADDEMVIARVSVWRILGSNGYYRDDTLADNGDGDELDLATAVGMLALAQHSMMSAPVETEREDWAEWDGDDN